MATDGPSAKRRKSTAHAQILPDVTREPRVIPFDQLDSFGTADTEAERNGFQLDPSFVRIKGGQAVVNAQALRTSGLELWLVQLPPGRRVLPMLHNQDLTLDVEAGSCSGSFHDDETGLSYTVSQESETLIPPLRVMNPKPSGKGFETLPVTRWVTLARDTAAADSQPPVLPEGVVREWPFVVDTYITQEERDGKGAMGSRPATAAAAPAVAAATAAKGTPARGTTASKESPAADDEAELKRQKKARKAAKAAAAAAAFAAAATAVAAAPVVAHTSSAAAKPSVAPTAAAAVSPKKQKLAAVAPVAAVSPPLVETAGKKKKRKSEPAGVVGLAAAAVAHVSTVEGSVAAVVGGSSVKVEKKAKRRASSAVGGKE